MSDDQAQMTADPALDQNTEEQGVTIDTPRVAEVTSQPSGMVHEETQTTSPVAEAQPKSEEVKPEAHAETIEDKRIAGKVSQIERERNALRKERDEVRSQFEKVANFLTTKPDVYKEALITTSGYTEEQAEEAVKALKLQMKEAAAQPQVDRPAQELPQTNNIREIVYEALKEAEERKARDTEIKDFISSHPEMDPKNISPAEMPLMKNIAVGIEQRAYQIMDESQLEGKSVTRRQALDAAYNEFRALSSREVAKAREQGEIEGMAKSNAMNSAVIRSGTVSGQGAAPMVSLTPGEAKVAAAAGMTPEEYASWRDKDAEVS